MAGRLIYVDFMENPNLKWMRTGGTRIPGNLHILDISPTNDGNRLEQHGFCSMRFPLKHGGIPIRLFSPQPIFMP